MSVDEYLDRGPGNAAGDNAMKENDVSVDKYLDRYPMPGHYREYFKEISKSTDLVFEAAAAAKSTLADVSANVESKIAYDLADRVARMHDLDVAESIRSLLEKRYSKEKAALIMATQIAKGEHMPSDATLEERLDAAVRVGLAIVTEGVTIAPLQGISEVSIRSNKDGSQYLSLSIAGPMRSAGGTESAATVLIADHVRKIAGLDRYQANSYGDDETGRFVEELRLYERHVKGGNFQYRVDDEDVVATISNLPVELDGVDTDPVELVNHRNMTRIKTDRVRGGALRVLNDGIIGRSKKLLRRIETYQLDGWDWLADLKGAVTAGDGEDASAKRMREVIVGRSVLSTPQRLGGFRLRYGRACNTGFASVGFHPAVAELLDHTIAAGTQVKIDMPGKGATVAFVDSIEAPTVLLRGGDVVKVRDVEHALSIKPQVTRILHLGDALVSFGDFLENNALLTPTGYVEEYWVEELRAKAQGPDERFLSETPAATEALDLSARLGIPLHPKYLHYWDQITNDDLSALLHPLPGNERLSYSAQAKPILEKMGVEHSVRDGRAVLGPDESEIFSALLFRADVGIEPDVSALENVSRAGIVLRPKFSTSIGVRIGRPEKASARHMKPPVHALFPVGDKGGDTRDICKASHTQHFFASIVNRTCPNCNVQTAGLRCSACGERTRVDYWCSSCKEPRDAGPCPACGRRTVSYSYHELPLREALTRAETALELKAREPLKGVRGLLGQDREAEPLEKGILRQAHDLTVFRDGTVRYDATNSPLTHFRPSWIGTSVERLRELGYEHDVDGRPLKDPEQMVELRIQDVVLPAECGQFLLRASKYVDKELSRIYGKEPFYSIGSADGLVGHLIVGLAPHTSVGIVGRVVGYAKTQVCFASPIWHSAKRRDADGDADSVMLLMDALLNFSRKFLSDRIGGLMDAPLLVQPLVMPYESQPQAHNFEVTRSLPLEFFEDTLAKKKASAVNCVDLVKKRLDSEGQFEGYHFTHTTSGLTTSRQRSAYSTLDSTLAKLELQIHNADMIDAVDTDSIVSNIIRTHLVRDIMGNLRSYAKQSFRCTACGRKWRRMPLQKTCPCNGRNRPAQTVTRASVVKYMGHAKRLVAKYDVGRYDTGRIAALSDEVAMVFGQDTGSQQLLDDY